jgi:uncharacterized protein (DUF2237 family)
MKLHGPTEHAIYAAMFTTRLGNELAIPRPPRNFNPQEWADRAADVAIGAAETAVTMHREAVQRRKP